MTETAVSEKIAEPPADRNFSDAERVGVRGLDKEYRP